jgi:hypothetical protein
MASLIIQLDREGTADTCALCGRTTTRPGQPCLSLAETHQAVCRDCGRRHAPSLASLLDLASAAERVGRIGRHTVVPPMTALLDLAHAAENFTHSTRPRQRQAA